MDALGNGSPRRLRKNLAGVQCLSSVWGKTINEHVVRECCAHIPGISNKEIPEENAPPLHDFGRKTPFSTVPIFSVEVNCD